MKELSVHSQLMPQKQYGLIYAYCAVRRIPLAVALLDTTK
jgi:hypothetical protein